MPTGFAGDLPSLERLACLFSYDPLTGIVSRRITANGRAKAGEAVGTKNSVGALICRVDYKIVYVHRLAWKLYYRQEPPSIIDHANGDCADNRIANMRAATALQNRWNSSRQRKTRSGLKGAHWSSTEGRWRSSIGIDGKGVHLGWFDTAAQAAEAYRLAAEKMQREFAFSKRR